MDRQRKTLQGLQKHWRQVVRSRRVVCTKQTRSQSRIPGFALRIAARSAKSVFGYFCRAWQKYHPFPLLVGEGYPSFMGGRWCFCCVIKSTIPSPCFGKQERTCSSSKGKEKRTFLFHVGKREATFAEYGKSSHRIPCLGDRNFPRGRPKKQSLHTQQSIRQLGTCRWSPSRRRELL